jgi:hypothetical protein
MSFSFFACNAAADHTFPIGHNSTTTFSYDVSMKSACRFPAVLLCMSTMLCAQRASSDHAEFHGTFESPNGDAIKLDTKTGTLVSPRSRGPVLQDCSDKFQVCLTDNHGFAFAYFRKCSDAAFGDYKRLRFRPKLVSVLHGNLWMVFDAAPNYMFHYADSKGIVGIYVGPTSSFDFRSALHDPNFNLANLDAMEYRITSSGTVAACGE